MVADEPLRLIAEYITQTKIESEEAFQTARACLADTLGCGILALKFKECTKLLGPVVSGTIVPNGSRVPGTDFVLDPIRAAFNIGTMVRWLDFNDTWLAAEWGHPSDNLGGILAIADFISRRNIAKGQKPLYVKEVLTAMIKAHEIQGGIAMLNSFNLVGFDHVILVKVATTAVVAGLLGATTKQIIDSVSNAWIDTGPLRTYRHFPNTGSRKSWAAGDATSRGVMLAMLTMQGEMGYPTALTTKQWGLYDVLFGGKPFEFQMPFCSYVMENVLFKIKFPAEFHAQTAVECAFQLHSKVVDKFDSIQTIEIFTHDAAIRIIDKKGPLNNPADRDHCLQYMVAIGLLFGTLKAEDYGDTMAKDPRIDALRLKMKVMENKKYSADYHDPSKRSIANAIRIVFKDGTSLPLVEVEYPLGHKRRRKEGMPLLFEKFKNNLQTQFDVYQVDSILNLFDNSEKLDLMPVNEFVEFFVKPTQ